MFPRPDRTPEGGGAPVGPANAGGRGMADWLCLAAAPTFAFMALLTAASGGSDMLCLGGGDASPLVGMTPMYLLMSAFHSAPWVRLASSRR